jgi:hypothetical protein
VLVVATVAGAEERQLVATLPFEVGAAALTPEHRTRLEEVARLYPPGGWQYLFEGDHDPRPFASVSPQASTRLNERLAESRWQSAAAYLGVPPLGLVRVTGANEARVYVQQRPPAPLAMRAAPAAGPNVQDSLAALHRTVNEQAERIEALERERAQAPPETPLAVARFEELHVRLDKWAEERWWEFQGGLELGILRVQPERPGSRQSGATLAIANGSPAYHPLDISIRLDLFRLGIERAGVTPALRWYDWDVRFHYGDDPEASTSLVNGADPVYLLGLDLDAAPWCGSRWRLRYAGIGARVHAADRELESYDQYDLRIDQRFTPRTWIELQAVYDERFEKSLCDAGGWLAHGWPLGLGMFSLQLGFVEQLDAFAATTSGREEFVGTVSLGLRWERGARFRY